MNKYPCLASTVCRKNKYGPVQFFILKKKVKNIGLLSDVKKNIIKVKKKRHSAEGASYLEVNLLKALPMLVKCHLVLMQTGDEKHC